ncbi:MAG: S41 family peptidase [Coxiellaceae bacterium]|nr:S41 family peptidase [Coxiellaceae bacterium]
MWRRFLAVIFVFVSIQCFANTDISQKKWLEDFDQLTTKMQLHYANMLYTYKIQHLNLPKLRQQTIDKIKHAKNEKQFKKAIYWFIAHFRDDHFTVFDPINYRAPIRLKLRNNTVIQASPTLSHCKLNQGDQIISLNNRSMKKLLTEYQQYVRFRDLRSRNEEALDLMVGTSIALNYPITVTGIHNGKKITCVENKLPLVQRKLPPICQKPEAYKGFQLLAVPHPNITILNDGEGYIKTGLISFKHKKKVGVLEINSFNPVRMQNNFCAHYWGIYTKKNNNCDARCKRKFIDVYLSKKVIDAYSSAITQLKKHHVDAILVDVLQNGGGVGDPADVLARLFSPQGIHSPRLRLVKTAESDQYLASLQATLNKLKKNKLNKLEKKWLRQGKKRLGPLASSIKKPCQLSSIWQKTTYTASCSNLTSGDLWPPGLYGYLNQKKATNKKDFSALYSLFSYNYQPDLFSGPVFVLMNRRSASSAEYVINMLKDNRPTTLIGEKTRGAGCGYHNLLGPVVLTNTKMQISMPNCTRYRKNGENAVGGTNPDIKLLVPDSKKAFQRFQSKLIHLLNQKLSG